MKSLTDKTHNCEYSPSFLSYTYTGNVNAL